MSATSSKIVSIIKDKENKGFNQYQNGKPTPPFPRAPIFFFYHQDINYSYCSFHFFEKWNLLANVIKKSPEDEKWLIFIREKGMRAEIEKNLKPFVSGNHISYIDAESKDSPMFRYIVKHKRFEGRVLIATSALDNGIGLCDPKLKHIVISTFDEESAIQMLGRKRRESNEPLDVYFRIPTATEVEAAYTYTKQLLEVVDTYNNDPSQFLNRYWGKLTPPIQKLFSIVPDGTLDINSPIGFFNNRNFYRLVLNKLAQDKLSYDKDLLGELSCCLKSTVEHSFEKVILSWFFEDEDIFSPSMLLKIDENEMKERIRSYIENLLEQELDKSQVEIHFKAIFELYGEMEGKNEKSFSASFKANLNACLEDLSLPFAFEKLKSSVKKDRWHFVKNN